MRQLRTYLQRNFVIESIRNFFSLTWGEGKSEPISRKTPRELGGLGLSDIVTKSKAIYFQHYFMSPCSDNFDHQ